MDALNILAEYHKEWVKIVRSFGVIELAEDVVQDVYIRIVDYNYEEKVVIDGEPNIGLMWVMLRNRSFQINKTGSVEFIPLDSLFHLPDYESEVEKHEAYERLHDKINKEIKNWDWYDQRLFDIYRDTNKSIRKLSSETSISVKSIFSTLKYCKERIKENVGDDYDDYKNEDYELI